MIRKITYVKQDRPYVSSGVLLELPDYLHDYYIYTPEGIPCAFREHDMLSVTSYSQMALGTGNHIGYSDVQVYDGENGENGRTDFTFTTWGNIFGPESDLSWRRGLMLTETYFDSTNTKVKEIENEYDFIAPQRFYGLQAQFAGKHPCAQATEFDPAYPAYFDQTVSVQLSEFVYLKKQTEEYFNDGLSLAKQTQYYFDNLSHLQPTRTAVEVNNARIVTATSYPGDYSNNSGFLQDLKDAHVVSVPVERVTWKENLAGDSARILSGDLFLYKTGGMGLVEQTKNLELPAPLPFANFKFSNRTLGTLPPSGVIGQFSPYNAYVDRFSYTYANAKPVEVLSVGENRISYIWGYNNSLPIAKVINAEHDRIAYTGFENDSEGNWDSYIANETDAYTGKRAFSGSLTKSGLPEDDYCVSAWVKNGTGLPSIAGLAIQELKSTRGWTLYEWKGALLGTVTINTNGSIIDDVRIHPVGSQMTTLSYDVLKGPSSISDANNEVLLFNYDRIGRLKSQLDSKGNVVRAYTYKYVH